LKKFSYQDELWLGGCLYEGGLLKRGTELF